MFFDRLWIVVFKECFLYVACTDGLWSMEQSNGARRLHLILIDYYLPYCDCGGVFHFHSPRAMDGGVESSTSLVFHASCYNFECI